MGERVLILGVTGVDKEVALRHLRTYVASQPNPKNIIIVHFEKEYVLKPNYLELHNYLDAPEARQREYWQSGWDAFNAWFIQHRDENILLSLHGVLTRRTYRTRSPLNIESIQQFSPTKIVTLIDDVYLQWWRTEQRAGGIEYIGRPKLEELLDNRRIEIFLGDFVASHISPCPPHYVLAVRHPARTMYRLLFGEDIIRVYLSFPISGPRRLLSEGDRSGINEINGFLKRAYRFEQENASAACFCPLSIDELPLSFSLDSMKPGDKLTFNLKDRWDVRKFCKDAGPLLLDEAILPKTITLPVEQVKVASGLINADVAIRDYRLVMQSRTLAVFNPWFKGKETGGVRNEIQYAVMNSKPVHIFQDPKHDSKDQAKSELLKGTGSMGSMPGTEYITFHKDLNALFNSIMKLK